MIRERIKAKQAEVTAQWAKYDEAVASGLTGAPLVRIDQKLGRLERELERLENDRDREAVTSPSRQCPRSRPLTSSREPGSISGEIANGGVKMEYERIETSDVRVGDRIARARSHRFEQVTDIAPGPTSSYITFENGSRIRPRHTAKLWREVQEPEAPTPPVPDSPLNPLGWKAAHPHYHDCR